MSAEVGTVKYKVELDDSGLDKDTQKAESKLVAGFKGTARAVGAAAVTATAAGTAAIVGLVKTATDSYSEYEQLVGGSKLMFGDAYDFIADKAQNAYKTVQMSTNDYLTQVNGLATGLKTALNGDAQAAAELADKVVTAEADVVAATGASQESVQNAFNGIMKSNFSMLDNLQIGINPTKEGFQEVIDKVNEWNAANGEATQYQIDNLADCQAALVDYIEMQGMAGYAANEAGDTLQGSLSMVQAAWENLTTGMADPDADIGVLVGNMVDSAGTFLNNLIPIIEQSLDGIAQAIAQLAPVIADEIPGMVKTVLPTLLNTGLEVVQSLAEGIINALPSLMPAVTDVIVGLAQMIVEMLPTIVDAGINVILSLALGIADALPDLVPAIVDCILKIVEVLTDPDNLMLLIDASVAIILGLAEGLIGALPKLLERAPEIIANLVSALIQALPKLIEVAVKLIETLVRGIGENLPKLLKAGGESIGKFVKGIADGLIKAIDIGEKIVDRVKEGISKLNPVQWGKDLISGFIDGIKGGWDALKGAAGGAAEAIASRLHFSVPDEGPLADADQYMPDFINLLAGGLEKGKDKLADASADLAGDIAMGFTSDINYNVPDLAGYAADLSASITGTGSSRIEVPVIIDGREIARASAVYMGEQLAWEAR